MLNAAVEEALTIRFSASYVSVFPPSVSIFPFASYSEPVSRFVAGSVATGVVWPFMAVAVRLPNPS
jgi:hypothetical protein